MKKILKENSLPLAYLALFLGSWVGHFVFQVVLSGENMEQFFSSTFENWQSEFLQLFFQMMLLKYLQHKGNPESRDTQEETDKKLDEILSQLKGLGAGGDGASGQGSPAIGGRVATS
jgi:hypothetical protein